MHQTTRRLLANAQNEKDVENAYKAEILAQVPSARITSPFGSDGYVEFETVRLLLEAKYDYDLKKRTVQGQILTQLIFYLKKFENNGQVLPNVLFVGDRNECFALSTSNVQKFLDMKIDWSSAASAGNAEVTLAIVEDQDIAPFVFNVDDTLNFKTVLDKIRTLAAGEVRKVRATPANIGAMFAYWQRDVFRSSGMTPVDQVDVFLKCLFGGAYLHPTKKMVVVDGKGEIPINVPLYKSFFSHFEQGYKPSEIEIFYAQKDRLIENEARRRQGAFFTPKIWADEAHRMIGEVLGPRWREECIVWDPAAGTGNLTRDYVFGDLILSTCEKADVDVIVGQGYNPEALVFQYDFLNDDESPWLESKNTIPDEVDDRLKKAAAEGKRLVFFMNPPYGTAANAGTNGTHKAGIADTSVNRQMKDAGWGPASQQLYAQFMFRCEKLIEEYGFRRYTVATYSDPKFMVSGSYRRFRDFWYKRFEYKSGMLFQASHFADTSSRWGISFTIWNEGTTDRTKDLPISLKDVKDFVVVTTEEKSLYTSEGRKASDWVRREVKGPEGQDAPQMTSGLKISPHGSKTPPKTLGWFNNDSNYTLKSQTDVFWMSADSTRRSRIFVTPDNFLKAAALFAARILTDLSWANATDEYLAPTPDVEASETYKQWNADAVIWAIIHHKNNSTAMRQVPYKGTLWTIHNHFFWMSQAEALKALDTPATLALYRDCKNNPSRDIFGNAVVSTPDPYLASILPGLEPLLSDEAKEVLAELRSLWIKSLPVREIYSQEHPDLHLGAWDAGVYQIKHLWRDLFPAEWEALKQKHKALADKLKPGIYDLGFLR